MLSIFPIIMLLPALLWLAPAEAPAQQLSSQEHPSLYKSPRAMGMGGAYAAVGGRVDTLFYNPAGLITIPRDTGWEVNVVNVSGEIGRDADAFFKDMNRALESGDVNGNGTADDDKLQAVDGVLARYRGRNLHARAADFTSLGKSFDTSAIGVGALGSAKVDAVPHQGLGADGMLEVNADMTYGGIGGFAFGLSKNLHAGFAIKALRRESLVHTFTARELVDHQSNLSDFIRNNLRNSGTAVGFDAGLLWKIAPNSLLRPSIGLSVLNIGDLNFGAAGKMPQTVNIGVAVSPPMPLVRSVIIAADYADATMHNRPDKDFMKRLRYGAEVKAVETSLLEFALRGGMYQSYPTFGIEARFAVVSLSYVSYSEEIGAYAGQDRNNRQLFTVNIGW